MTDLCNLQIWATTAEAFSEKQALRADRVAGNAEGWRPDAHYWRQVQELCDWCHEAYDALEALIDPDPCRFDHSGFCQAHTNEDEQGLCWNGKALDIVKRGRALKAGTNVKAATRK